MSGGHRPAFSALREAIASGASRTSNTDRLPPFVLFPAQASLAVAFIASGGRGQV